MRELFQSKESFLFNCSKEEAVAKIRRGMREVPCVENSVTPLGGDDIILLIYEFSFFSKNSDIVLIVALERIGYLSKAKIITTDSTNLFSSNFRKSASSDFYQVIRELLVFPKFK